MEIDLMFKDIITLAEIYIIKRDCEILKDSCIHAKPDYSVMLAPYASLFCYEILKFFNNSGEPIQIDFSSKYSFKDIRNKTKFFDVRINQLFNIIRNVDDLQNKEFINYMKYTEFGKWNIHDNIGITFDNENHIIFNTHYAYYIFQDNNLIKRKRDQLPDSLYSDPRLIPEEIRAYSYDLGRVMGSISDGFSNLSDFICSKISTNDIKLGTKDFNTNRIWIGNDSYKIVKIFLLHVLSSINFILYILKKLIIHDTGWLLRIEYISYYYVLRRLSELKIFVSEKEKDMGDPNLKDVLNKLDLNLENNKNLNSDFRNCMMHYGIKSNGGRILLDENHFNLGLPLCGLVESIFNGISYWEYQKIVEIELEKISLTLSEYLNFDLRDASDTNSREY